MMIKNNKGFGSREMLTVSVVCLILATIILVIAIQSSYGEKFKVMEYNARVFGLSATTYQMENNNAQVSMMELLDNGLFTKIKNPFGGEKYCDIVESKVEYEDDKKYISLRCGNYLIDHQYIEAEKYNIYRVGAWEEEKPRGTSQKLTAYNYKENGENGFNQLYDENMFLYVFNKKMGSDYSTISEIPKEYQVFSVELYRTKTLVNTVDNQEEKED